MGINNLFNITNFIIGVRVFNATFNNISVITRRSVLLPEETGVPGENHWLSQVTQFHYKQTGLYNQLEHKPCTLL